MVNTLFAYGSLRVPEIMKKVAGDHYASQSATLQGYACYCVKNATYPGLLAEAGAETQGCIYQGLTQAAWQRLDAFEGTLYIREPVTVATEANQKLTAQTYIILPEKIDFLTSVIWDFDHFLTHDLHIFIKRNFGVHLPSERGSSESSA